MEALWISLGLPREKEERKKVKRFMNVQRRQKKMFGLKAKLYHAQLHAEKIYTKKMHEKRNSQTEAW